VRVPPPLIFLSGLLLGWAAEAVVATPNLRGTVRLVVLIVLLVAGGVLGAGALRRFVQQHTAAEPWKPSSSLVTSGPYRFTRNPMYLGMACLYLGLALVFGLLWAVALLPVVLVVIDRQVIAREERYLQRRFGQDYLDYQQQVRRWL
jgi:protein-S-isoprenylcysteine O-methyltransferase Ste14